MRIVLTIVAFAAGAVVMILELTASRIVAPYLGTSVIVWTSLIGVILAALAFGNWLGGKAADRYPTPEALALILVVAGALVAAGSHFQSFLGVVAGISDLQSASVIGVGLLFGPATIALGMITPLAIKLLLTDMAHAGRTAGNLYALSNAGSIIGTFLGGFFLISYVGSTRILTVLSFALVALALIVYAAKRHAPSKGAAAAALVAVFTASLPSGSIILGEEYRVLADIDTRYSRNWVFETALDDRVVRVLSNSVGGFQSGVYVDDPDTLVFEYTKMYDAFEAFVPDAKRALMIGGSAYTYPRHFLAADPDHRIDVVEIDARVTDLAREYFGLADDPRLMIAHEDGRTYLNRSHEAYDVIFMDAFLSQLTIPFHLTTQEAVQRIAANLADDGIVMVNIISPLEGEADFLAAERATYASVFPHVALYRVTPYVDARTNQNVMLVASKKPLDPVGGWSSRLTDSEWHGELPAVPVLTDDFAPIERYTYRALY